MSDDSKTKATSAATRSPQTTIGGVLAFFVALAVAAQAQFDGDPTTSAEWSTVIAAALLAFSLWKARDHSTSSEAAGVK